MTTTAMSHEANYPQLKQRRARSQLSCTPCRQGKLKCDRSRDPACDQCLKRNRDSQCVYLPPPAKNKPSKTVKGRIRQLESLVVDLMNQNKAAPGTHVDSANQANSVDHSTSRSSTDNYNPELTPPSDGDTAGEEGDACADSVNAATPLFGSMRISKNEVAYVGEAHWGSILNSISELRREIGDDPDDAQDDADEDDETHPAPIEVTTIQGITTSPQDPTTKSSFDLLLGRQPGKSLTKAQLLAALPEKRVADRLLSLWFNSPDPFKSIIHAPTFQDTYRRLWREPDSASVMWLGLMFSILSLATSFGLRDLDPASARAREIFAEANKYHQLAASAAALADFTKTKPFTLECLIMYSCGMRSSEAFVNVWLMMGLIFRLALRMGYHRDPKHFPAITPYEGEMRRRVWAILSMIDVLLSFQLGLPSMVKTIQADADAPRNLLDRDFSVSTTELPPGRPISELTPCSYVRAKIAIVKVFADASELNHATVLPNPEEVMRLDQELEDARELVPPMLRMPDISELVTDPAEQLMCRFNLDLLYLKTKIVLHRRYMMTPKDQLTPQEQARGIGNSRMAAANSALRVLQHHHTIYMASQPGGQLESVKWYMSSISTHDFLLAAMIICLDLSSQIKQVDFRMMPDGKPCSRRADLVKTLERTHKIWSESSRARKARLPQMTMIERRNHVFDETDKAARAMGVMLDRVKKTIGAEPQQKSWPNPTQASALQALSAPDQFNALFDPQAPVSDVTIESNHNNTSPESFGAVPSHTSPTGSTSRGPSTTATTTSDAAMDFTLTGDMLELDSMGAIDWQSWDNEIQIGLQEPYTNYKNMTDISDGTDGNGQHALNAVPDGHFIPGNVLLGNGGSGVVDARTWPGTSGDSSLQRPQENFQYLWPLDAEVNNPLDDLDMDELMHLNQPWPQEPPKSSFSFESNPGNGTNGDHGGPAMWQTSG